MNFLLGFIMSNGVSVCVCVHACVHTPLFVLIQAWLAHMGYHVRRRCCIHVRTCRKIQNKKKRTYKKMCMDK